jgi:cellulose synthase operon protein C
MSQSPTYTSPPDASAPPSNVPSAAHASEVPAASAEASASDRLARALARLRAELAVTTDPTRQARLLADAADIEEQAGDQPGAARDYLAAYNAAPSFREPLEGLVRLLERRRSLKNLGRLIDALVRAAVTPDERVRALVMKAWHEADVGADVGGAKELARSATEPAPAASGGAGAAASASELAVAWLLLEVLAGRTGDVGVRRAALAERTRFTTDAAWRALLLVDCARLAIAADDAVAALAHLEQARAAESEATWTATLLLEEILREHPGLPESTEIEARASGRVEALEAIAGLMQDAIGDAARGDALGVPHWVRQADRVVDGWMRAADGWRALGRIDRAGACLERAAALVDRGDPLGGGAWQLAHAAIANARIRIAESTGATGVAADLAERRLMVETDPGLASALAMRVAEHAVSVRDEGRAFAALGRALGADPGCIPARAMQLDMLADGGEPDTFAAQLESFAETLATDEARGRVFLLAAYVWAVNAKDIAGAKGALSQAAMFGVEPATAARLGRALAGIVGDFAWYEEGTKRLIAGGGAEEEMASLYVELLRARHARGDGNAAVMNVLREMAAGPRTAWLAHALQAYLPPGAPVEGDAAAAVERDLASLTQLTALESDPDLARGLGIAAAMRAQAGGDPTAALARLANLARREPGDPIVGAYLADLARGANDHGAAARVASDLAASASDADLAASMRLEAALELWKSGDKAHAFEEMEAAATLASDAANAMLAWAAWGLDTDSRDGRRRAIDAAARAGGDAGALALDRFAAEIGGDAAAAGQALAILDSEDDPALGAAGVLAHLTWTPGASDTEALARGLERLAALGPGAATLAASEGYRIARESGDVERAVATARRWFDLGGGATAAVEWFASATTLGAMAEEEAALLALASALPDDAADAREAIQAGAAMLGARRAANAQALPALVAGDSHAARLANLELSPPGCDPRRRATALGELGGALGNDAMDDAASLSGWSWFAVGDYTTASAVFEEATRIRATDLAAWEGLRACAEQLGDAATRARAASELGARCHDTERGAGFWEEAGLLLLELGDQAAAEHALEASFTRDAGRTVAFDKLFRRVRERKDNDKLLAIVGRRLEATDDPAEIQKLFWEQARVLREKGDQDGALAALEHVTMLDPDHVGALALVGEINIRRGNFEDAAASLGRLARLDAAPAKNRVTAGVAAVDLYENKLGKPEAALELLVVLHRAGLSTLPVRERLARAAARTGAWTVATAILELLMVERPDAKARVDAARLAMAIYRDRLNDAQGAAAAVVKLLEEEPADPEALELLVTTRHVDAVRLRLLKNARTALSQKLAQTPTDVAAVRLLAKVASALGDDALHQAALGTLMALGGGDARSEAVFAQLALRKEHTPQIAVSASMLRAILAPGDEGPVAELFTILGPTLAEALGPGLQSCGVGRRDKVDPRSGLALRNEIAAWAGALGVHEFDLYVGGKDPLSVQGVPGEPPALVVGAGINAPLAPLARARIARELLGIVRGTTITRSRDETSIAAVVVAACKLAEVRVDHPPYAVLAEIERLVGKAIARKTRKSLPEVCQAIVSRGADARAWSKRALASLDRMALVASGDPTVVLADLLSVPAERVAAAIPGDARAEDLIRFALSDACLELRRGLGLERGARP